MVKTRPVADMILFVLIMMPVLSVFSFPSRANTQAEPTISLDPQFTQTLVNSTFVLDLDITGAHDVCSWQAYIYYRNDVLEGVSYFEGQFLQSHGSTLFDGEFHNDYNQTHGQLWMYGLRTWTGSGVDGDGTLAVITFRGKNGGTSPVNLADTVLGNASAQPIDHTTRDAEVQVGGDDIALLLVSPNKNIVGQGFEMKINVTVANQGYNPETFNVTVYANTSSINLQTITLSNGSSTVVTSSWNTTGWSKGNYTMSAYAWPPPGDTNTANNNCTCTIPVHVGVPGDVSGTTPGVYDGITNMKDVAYLVSLFNTKPSSPNWQPNADVNDDGVCNMKDIAIAVVYFNQHE